MFSISLFRNLVTSFVAMVLLVGCASGPQFAGLDPVQQDKSNIYVYRNPALFASGQGFRLSLDDKSVGTLYNASYQKLSVEPGKHTLEIAPGIMAHKSALEVMLEPNKNYFYEYDFASGPLANVFFVGSSIQAREQNKALDDLKALKRAE